MKSQRKWRHVLAALGLVIIAIGYTLDQIWLLSVAMLTVIVSLAFFTDKE